MTKIDILLPEPPSIALMTETWIQFQGQQAAYRIVSLDGVITGIDKVEDPPVAMSVKLVDKNLANSLMDLLEKCK